jgi:hypothetical protein
MSEATRKIINYRTNECEKEKTCENCAIGMYLCRLIDNLVDEEGDGE